ncbi:MAG TPA: O-antigen ligase family protein [Gaiellaceae bacterium]|jgi:O-antigen ligase|nr:O-antigen ligase family protein [Gaiellaceae bacterium]
MRLILGAAQRGEVRPLVLLGALLVITIAAALPGPAVNVAPYVALLLGLTLLHARVLSWKSLLALTIAIILFIPIRRYTMPGSLPFELEPYRLMVAFLGAGWMVSMLVDNRVRLRSSGLEAPLVLFGFGALASIVVNTGHINALAVQDVVLKKLTFFASFYLILYLIVSVAHSRQLIDWIVKWLVAGGAIVSAFAIYEAWTGFNIFSNLQPFIPILDLAFAPELDVRGSRLRVFASAQHPIALGVAFVMLLPLAVYLAKKYRQRRWFLACGVIVLACFSTVSRTTILMLVIVFIVFLRLRPRETKRLWRVLLPGLIVVHLALPGALGTLQESFFPEGGLIAEQQAGAGGRGSGRLADVGPSLDEWKRQFVLGQGFGTRVVDEGRINAMILDNQWLGTLLETGLVGVIAWIWLFRRFLKLVNAEARRDRSDRGWLLTALSASVLAYALAMLTYDAWSFIQVTFLLFILLGVGAVALQQREETVPARTLEPAPTPLGVLEVPVPATVSPAYGTSLPARRSGLVGLAKLPNLLFALGLVLSFQAVRSRER